MSRDPKIENIGQVSIRLKNFPGLFLLIFFLFMAGCGGGTDGNPSTNNNNNNVLPSESGNVVDEPTNNGNGQNNLNHVPLANLDNASTQTVTPVVIAVLDNDTGTEDAPITLAITSAPSNGTVIIEENNTVTYTPDSGYFGTDRFSYRITDADSETSDATVEIIVVCTSGVCTKTLRVAWNANPESHIAGYYLHHGTQPGLYPDKIWVGNVTSYDFETADLTEHFFAVSAKNVADDESSRSAPVSISLAQ